MRDAFLLLLIGALFAIALSGCALLSRTPEPSFVVFPHGPAFVYDEAIEEILDRGYVLARTEPDLGLLQAEIPHGGFGDLVVLTIRVLPVEAGTELRVQAQSVDLDDGSVYTDPFKVDRGFAKRFAEAMERRLSGYAVAD
ncbi:MAG: hypothetical protein HKN04_06175 [Rhodothermaceae bacterium]|nr:hypothetical protein [Rhodothermaceae bacterium]